ncbi:MAG TPA: hypothetical protein VLJ42_05350 [Solirubrobacteraceae bacterium]|nr:hypothetical protein [Solirubrobacteraceae bacterium]
MPNVAAMCEHRCVFAFRRAVLAAMLAALMAVTLAASAAAQWFGSTMTGVANTAYGCESALILGPVGGVELAPTNQTSCTYRHGGYLNSLRPTFIVPSSGWIRRIQVKSGPNPARLRITVLTGSSRVDTFAGHDIPGTYTCCTARYVGPSFRPKPNAITTRRVNIRVFDLRSKDIEHRIHSSDGLALSAVGPGTVPLYRTESVGTIVDGAPFAIGYFPMTRPGDPRVDGYSMAGLDLLYRWDFRRR